MSLAKEEDQDAGRYGDNRHGHEVVPRGAAVLALGGMLILMTVILHSDYSPGTIGEYPPELRGEVNFKETAVHIAIIGSLLLVVYAMLSAAKSAAAKVVSINAILPFGRILLGLYFITNASWQLYYYEQHHKDGKG